MPLRHATLRQLRVFEAVAQHLSFSRAAAALHLTQPAVSMQVKSLEAQAGLPLFELVGKKVRLTDAGRELYLHSQAIGRELAAAEDALGAMRGLTRGSLTIALVSTAKYFAPPLLGRFLKAHPGVTLRLEVENREAVMRRLAANEVDLAITGRPPEDLAVTAEPFARHPHAILCAPGHPLAGRRRMPLERVAAEPFIIREAGSGTRGLLERLFAAHGLTLNVAMEMSSNETIKQAVIADMGIAFLSLHTAALELATGKLAMLDVVGLPVVRSWFVVHLARKRLSPVAQAFKAFLVAEGARALGGQAPARPPRRRGEGL